MTWSSRFFFSKMKKKMLIDPVKLILFSPPAEFCNFCDSAGSVLNSQHYIHPWSMHRRLTTQIENSFPIRISSRSFNQFVSMKKKSTVGPGIITQLFFTMRSIELWRSLLIFIFMSKLIDYSVFRKCLLFIILYQRIWTDILHGITVYCVEKSLKVLDLDKWSIKELFWKILTFTVKV